MTRYSSVYELEAELKAKGFRTTPDVDYTVGPDDDIDAAYLDCPDGRLYEYPKYKFYIIKAN